MNRSNRFPALLAMIGVLALPPAAWATDVDGPNDCFRAAVDFGDAPEGIQAYGGGVLGAFPTCLQPGPIGTLNVACGPGGPVPGPAGFVRHAHSPTNGNHYWLGCTTAGGPLGIDSEQDGKVNDNGVPQSACLTSQTVDCFEAAFGLNFGQDECYGTDDAAIGAALTFTPCVSSSVPYSAYSCNQTAVTAYLNVLVDWNHDGDWNDDVLCVPNCASEWAVRNVSIVLAPGCNFLNTPAILAGPDPGDSWLRISISDQPAPADYAWNGTAGIAGQTFTNGETEDYPVRVGPTEDPCPPYQDWGDAPEEAQAYPGVIGCFPTCGFPTGPGTYNVVCLPPRSTPPGLTGYVKHVAAATDPRKFWLGCPTPAGALGVDGEADGKVNDNGTPFSNCSPNVLIDCIEAAFGIDFGQDECYGDEDAGITGPLLAFDACEPETVEYKAYNCYTEPVQVFLNILVDMNKDGDWNDNFTCPAPPAACAYEWAVKNEPVLLPPGCSTLDSPGFLMGPYEGDGWLRISLTPTPVSEEFPWDGSAGPGGDGFFTGGETEDYPIRIGPPEVPCPDYEDWGDAPEMDARAYPGVPGHFPTCSAPTPPGTYDVECFPARSTPPGLTGYVKHLSGPAEPFKFWLGCPNAAGDPGVDSEIDGKMNDNGGAKSMCDTTVAVDCTQFFGIKWGQDECYGDGVDAGLAGPTLKFKACKLSSFEFSAYNCKETVDVYLNVLVDWNEDGDWNDNFRCTPGTDEDCAYEWAVKNVPIVLAPGCQLLTTPLFRAGPKSGKGWLRITLTKTPVSNDFPWDGSAGPTGDGLFSCGETEDYPVVIRPDFVGVDDEIQGGALMFAPLSPNPASNNVQVQYTLPSAADVSLAVYDIAGRKLAVLEKGRRAAGEHRLSWNFQDASGRPVAAGQYVLRLRVGDRVLTQRVMRVP